MTTSPNSTVLNGSSSTAVVSSSTTDPIVVSPTSSSSSSISNSNSNSSNSLKPSLNNSNNSTNTNNISSTVDIIEHISISYQDESSVWKYVEVELPNHLPLKNISWKTKTGHTKVVEKMPIEILQYNDERVKAHYDNQNLYKKPYLYLYLVHCDDPDNYKNVIRAKIKTWVTQMTERQQEWLIVYISLGPKRFSELTSKLTRTVYDRIKNDFNVKRDRCCQLRFLDDQSNHHDDLWDDFLNKMKEGIISSAEQYLTTYEDEIRKMDAKRNAPGWNYQQFFFIKEGLALIYERAQLYEDALMQYFELEVLFTDNNHKQSQQFECITDECLQSNSVACNGNILDTSFKNYRKLIHENKISLFDFKIYLFARQSKLLFLLQKPIEAATKSISFITSISLIIKQYPNSFSPLFKESWIFSTSMELIKACQDSFDKIVNGIQQQQAAAAAQQQLPNVNSALLNNTTTTSGGSVRVKSISSTTPSISKFLGVLGTSFSSNSNNNNNNNTGTNSGSSGLINGKNNIPTTSNIASLAGLSGSQSLNNLQSAQLSNVMNTQSYIRTPSLNLTGGIGNLSGGDMRLLLEKQDRESLDFLIGDLMFSSAQRLEELAIKVGFLPVDDYNSELFFQIVDEVIFKNYKQKQQDDDTSTTPTFDSQNSFSYQPLQVSFQSQKQFTILYLELLGQIEKLYIQSNRMRSISRLTFAIANLNFKLREFSIAENLFKSISNLYSREGWSYIEYAVKTRLSYCQKQLGHMVDYVTTCTGLLAPGLLSNQLEKNHYLSEIIEISKNSSELNIVQPMIPLFKCKVTCKESVVRYLETVTINVRIKSRLISPLKFNNGSVSFVKSGTPDKLIFQLNDFVVEPGTNHYQFTALASIKASFVKDSIWLKLGSNLSFGHSLRGESDNSTLKVIDSESQITLESFANSPLLFCSIQYIGIKLHTHSDTIEAGVLSFTSPTGATIISTPYITLIQTNNKTGECTSKQINLINDKLPLSQIGYNETLEFYLPLMAVNTDACTHQIKIELQHQKQTKEKFSSSLVSSILFINPLSISESIISSVANRLFLKTIIQCNAPNMIQFNSYQLDGCDLEFIDHSQDSDITTTTTTALSSSTSSLSSSSNSTAPKSNSFYLIKDHNHSLLSSNLNLYPGQIISLIFEIKKYNENDITQKEMKLKIKYTSKMLQSELDKPLIKECKSLWRDVNEFVWPIKIDSPSYIYQIDLQVPEKSYLGNLIPFGITITNLRKQQSSSQSSPPTPSSGGSAGSGSVQYSLNECLLYLRGQPEVSPTWASIMRDVFWILHNKMPEKQFFFLKADVYDFMNDHWDILCPNKKKSDNWRKQIRDTLSHYKDIFESGMDKCKQKGFWRLKNVDLCILPQKGRKGSSSNCATPSVNQIQYHIEFDSSIWMISGKNKHSFSIEDGENITFNCHLIPISAGSLPIPKVTLVGCATQNILLPKTKNEKIYIYPTHQIYLTCHPMNNNNNNNIQDK